jgi:hypothetical protein
MAGLFSLGEEKACFRGPGGLVATRDTLHAKLGGVWVKITSTFWVR